MELTQQALEAGIAPAEIMNTALIPAMARVGQKFTEGKIFVPQMLLSAKAMNSALTFIKPYFSSGEVQRKGTFIIGTVFGDLHDIGKNLVCMMVEGVGWEVIDLGVDVAPETFIRTAVEKNCAIIGCSALLTTTMCAMEDVVRLADEAGIRDRVKIMVGGAPVDQRFCDKIGADAYTRDAATAADVAAALLGK